jgi:tyrosyl-tRNA synthetase
MMTKQSKLEKINALFEREIIADVLPDKESFIKALMERQLTFYIGFDATSTALHLSHAKNFMLMEDFRKLGHRAIILFGDFTARIGDPSDRESVRQPLTSEQTMANIAGWREQIKNLISFDDSENPAEIRFNSEWLDKMNLEKLIGLAAQTTVQRMLERDMFQKRMRDKKPIHLHEFLYPLLQGFDSVALNADVEMCGTDQTFNSLMGRQLVKSELGKEKFCLIVNTMVHPETGEPMMSKSKRQGVFLDQSPNDMFGGIMALPDCVIEMVLLRNTRIPLSEIDALNIKKNPRDAKIFAATKVVEIFHGTKAAEKARQNFIDTFSKREFPENAPVVHIGKEKAIVFEILKTCLPKKSNSDIRRLISQGAVSINGSKCDNEKQEFDIANPLEIKVGKLDFFSLKQKA